MVETRNDKGIQELANLMRKAREKRKGVMILAGSGISKSAGIPLFDEILSKFREKSKSTGEWDDAWGHLPDFNSLTPNKKYDLVRTRAWKETIEDVSKKIREATPTKAHKIIAELCKHKYMDYVFSLNYDDLFERAFGGDEGKYVNIIRFPERMKELLSKPKNKVSTSLKNLTDSFI
ncbi:MAG: hypothetical protein DNFNHJIP_00421 [Candidatus Argoarchaeum ethanivorans]|uniref:Deacetylase sirtuin-type domain-containing protein n=1 Tax=Candidatus Argoarchaeum ethanivorans TaxID=2608793 RepID=A0A812A2J4_9EURY|nr:MAG: hypothetical protein DNFNHJIP_00421 [Candidatus Argoarchaeum ethanivorans]